MSDPRQMLEEFARRMASINSRTAGGGAASVEPVDYSNPEDGFTFVRKPRSTPLPSLYSPVPEGREPETLHTCSMCGAHLATGRSCRRCVDVPENT